MLDGTYLTALALTLASELPIVLVGFRRARPRSRTLLVFAAANLLTHGTLWAAWYHLPGEYPTRLLVCELAVFAAEALLYRALLGVSLARAAIVSAAANLLSTAIGLVLQL
ncbi:MAG TPA: hypothetical protein VFF06_22965 [Polyangia bacterium]|nr:hypothetical protein [Polyangia bacterium]